MCDENEESDFFFSFATMKSTPSGNKITKTFYRIRNPKRSTSQTNYDNNTAIDQRTSKTKYKKINNRRGTLQIKTTNKDMPSQPFLCHILVFVLVGGLQPEPKMGKGG